MLKESNANTRLKIISCELLVPIYILLLKKSFHNDYKEEKITFFYIKAATRKTAKTENKNANKSPIATKSVRKPEIEKSIQK